MDDAAMDAELQAAGGRFRAQHSAAPSPAQVADFDLNTHQPAAPPRRRWTVLIAAAVIVALGGTGGWLAFRGGSSGHSGTQQAGTADGLTGWQWGLTSIDSTGSTGSAYGSTLNVTLKGVGPSVSFGPGLVVGSDGCNTFSGPADISAATIRFGNIYTTTMGCVPRPNGQDFESVLDSFFAGSITWSITGDSLELIHDGTTLRFTRGDRADFGEPSDSVSGSSSTAPAAPEQMVGTWNLVEYDQSNGSAGGGSASGSGDSGGFDDLLVVAADGTFKVQHRCYANAGDVAVDPGVATWSNVHLAGAIPCPSTADQAEKVVSTLVDSVLDGKTSWQVAADGQLHITHGGDSLVYAPEPPSGSGSTSPAFSGGPTS